MSCGVFLCIFCMWFLLKWCSLSVVVVCIMLVLKVLLIGRMVILDGLCLVLL